MTSDSPALAVRGLAKRFERPAVDGLDLVVRAGEFYALVGPNGAGKTTTLRMVAGLLRPDAGEIAIFGIDALREPIAAKQMMAWVSDEPMIYDKLTPLEYLEFVAGLWGIDPAASGEAARELLVSLGLEGHLHERCEGFSKGMRQKVGIAIALAKQAKALLLDEPTSGLDPSAANEFSELLINASRSGVAVLTTTHDLFHAKQTGTRIGIMKRGRLVEELKSEDVSHADLEALYLKHMKN
ncbi:MAG: ABC transporter ATP-binding protein [Bradyrhizobium sp.]|nr:ABC transporter ATP-binding protein [Bradyrhizobium sp.]